MPITVRCACGKSFTVGDEFAGRTGKCKACGAALVVPVAEPASDVELLDDEPKPAPVKAVVAVEAVEAVAEEPAAARVPGVVGTPKAAKKPKPKKKKKKRAAAGLSAQDEVAKVIAYEARVQRTVAAAAYIALGLVILGGAWYMWYRQRDEVVEGGGQSVLGVLVVAGLGAAAVGKGLFGLVFGHFLQLGDED